MWLVTDLSSKSQKFLPFECLCLLKYRLICVIKESGLLTSSKFCPKYAETVKYCQVELTGLQTQCSHHISSMI